MNKNTVVVGGALCLAACGVASEGGDPGHDLGSIRQALDEYIGPISEEVGKNSATCYSQFGASVSAWASCYGSYCDDMYLGCSTAPQGISLAPASAFWTPYVSEEGGSPAASCGFGAVLNGLRATGQYSDNVSAYCLPMYIDDSQWAPHGVVCNWTSWVSEELGTTSFPLNGGRGVYFGAQFPRYAKAVRCSGSYCDSLSFYGCTEAAYDVLDFYAGDNRNNPLTDDWSSNDHKAECGAGQYQYMGGISATASSDLRGHAALCVSNSDRVDWWDPNLVSHMHTHSLTGPLDDRADTGTGDWDYAFFKAECARNEVMLGVSQTSSEHNMSKILCVPMNQTKSDPAQCNTLVFSTTADNRLNTLSFDWRTGSTDWDYGFVKNECALDQVLKGVSSNPQTGEIHSLLCCHQQPDANP